MGKEVGEGNEVEEGIPQNKDISQSDISFGELLAIVQQDGMAEMLVHGLQERGVDPEDLQGAINPSCPRFVDQVATVVRDIIQKIPQDMDELKLAAEHREQFDFTVQKFIKIIMRLDNFMKTDKERRSRIVIKPQFLLIARDLIEIQELREVLEELDGEDLKVLLNDDSVVKVKLLRPQSDDILHKIQTFPDCKTGELDMVVDQDAPDGDTESIDKVRFYYSKEEGLLILESLRFKVA